MLAEAHSRLAAPLYNIAFMFLALTAVIGGPFSRLGYGARIAVVAAAALVARTLGFAAQAASGATPMLNGLQYAIPLGVAVVCACILLRPGSRNPASRRAPAAPREAPLAVSA